MIDTSETNYEYSNDDNKEVRNMRVCNEHSVALRRQNLF